jgi:hypothetical protein
LVLIVRILWFVSMQDMMLFSPQKRPGKLWGTSLLFKGREADFSYPPSVETRIRTPVLTFPLYLQGLFSNKFIFTFGDFGIQYQGKCFFLFLVSVNRLHSSRRSFIYSHLLRFCVTNVENVRLFSSYWQRSVFGNL